MIRGDLVAWSYPTEGTGLTREVGIVIDVRDWDGYYPEEVLVKFPPDGAEMWFLSRKLLALGVQE
jgi:hypothetical protein